jgi:hypothetical protein
MPERLSAADAAATARRMWTLFEPVHAVSYCAAEPIATFEQAGAVAALKGLPPAAEVLATHAGTEHS